ncbi:unnamed protein product, partial [Rotaria sordida]
MFERKVSLNYYDQ